MVRATKILQLELQLRLCPSATFARVITGCMLKDMGGLKQDGRLKTLKIDPSKTTLFGAWKKAVRETTTLRRNLLVLPYFKV